MLTEMKKILPDGIGEEGFMNFFVILALRYMFSTAALFLLGVLMHFFDGEVERLGKTD
ncbi:MAG: hypothetical protein K2H91_06335 [Lachnospiraceae bacterium]|nr:hypothetical protein [Lachnospiraceae bacterium]